MNPADTEWPKPVEHISPELERLLTARECDVVRLLACGLSDKDIAQRLFVSHRYVKNCVYRILCKLHFDNRTQVAIEVVRYDERQLLAEAQS